MEKKWIVRIVGSLFLSLGLGSIASANQTHLDMGASLYSQSNSTLLSKTGYFMNFQVEKDGKWFRPTFGGQLELNSGANSLVFGHMLAGFQMAPSEAKVIRPYIGAQALLGWANFSMAEAAYIGLVYGGELSVGAEIRFSKKSTGTALRVSSQYRYTQGSIGGGLSGSDLSAVQIALGILF